MLQVYNMLIKSLVLIAVVTGATANWDWKRWDDDESSVKPPNCNCTRKNWNDTNWEPKPWMTKWMKPDETIDQFKARMRLKKQVCGTNNVTYVNKCEFVNNASLDKALGIRCHGPCPCSQEEDDMMSKMKRHFPRLPLCLNNGDTVYGFEAAREATRANSSLGVRCMGECAECQNDLKCPPQRGPHGGHRRHRRHCKRMSNETAPNCTCTEPSDRFKNSFWGQKFLEKRKVCGSNGVTYKNKCEFLNGQAIDAGLGKRCRGACPCDFENRTRSESGGSWGRRGPGPARVKSLCLNNGATVNGWREASDAMKGDTKLGIRCKGECSQCQSKPLRCPFDWVKYMNEKEASRPQPPNCTCPKMAFGFAHHRGRKVCGNNNQTYNSICDLINAQPGNAKLGFRCLGECPCRHRNHTDEPEMPLGKDMPRFPSQAEDGDSNEIESQDDSERDDESSSDSDDQSPREDTENSDAPGQNKDEGDEDSDDQNMGRRPHWRPHHHRRHHHHRRWRRFPICLTNNQTVRGWRQVARAFRNDTSVGIRCKGHCDWCANHARCPRFPPAEEMQQIRRENMIKMRRFAQKWESMTIENPDKPPKCSCSFPPNPTRRNWGFRKHGNGGHKMFSMCGNNNVTFETMCDLVNNQFSQPDLGSRCFGKCPCNPEEFQVDEDDEIHDRDLQAENEKAEKPFKFAFCLTNGQTVHKRTELKQALASNLGLGIRCMNECSACELKCPRLPKPWGEIKTSRRNEISGPGRDRKKWRMDEKFSEESDEKYRDELKGQDEGQMEDRAPFENKWDSPAFEFKKASDFGYGWNRRSSKSYGFWNEQTNVTDGSWECEGDDI